MGVVFGGCVFCFIVFKFGCFFGSWGGGLGRTMRFCVYFCWIFFFFGWGGVQIYIGCPFQWLDVHGGLLKMYVCAMILGDRRC